MTIDERNNKLNEIQNKINSVHKELIKLRKERHRLELACIDVTGKYIKIDDLGYMYVTYQGYGTGHINGSDDNGHPQVWLRGFFFNGHPGHASDNFYFTCDAMYSLYINEEEFINKFIDTKEIYEISEDEFKTQYQDLVDKFNAMSISMIDRCKKSLEY